MSDDHGKGNGSHPPAHFVAANGSSSSAAQFGRAEDSLVAGMDAIGAALAHELNQPLTALSLYLHSLKRLEAAGESPEIRELVEKALHESDRATDIVKRMRRLSLRSEPDRRPVNLNDLSREVMDLALLNLPRRPKVRSSLAPDLPLVSGDPVQLRQIIVNLLRNAAEAAASSRTPAIFLSTAINENVVQLTVADNGPGVDPRISSRLFKAFETSKPNGQGLGLAISRMIAQNHGGDVVMKSEVGDQGAVFALKLPLR